jgi:hypothetical protein
MSKVHVKIEGQTYDLDSLALPASGRKFREAWKVDGDVVKVDLEKAKAIHQESVRTELQERVRQRGGAFGTPPTEAEARAYNDPKIAAAASIEELEALTLEELLKSN